MSAHTAREAMQEFTVWLETERRASEKTIEAYQRDIGNFIGFLVEHLGGEPHVSDLKRLSRHDVVAWLARRQIGGVTGDVLGAVQQGTETAMLLALVAQG